MKVKYATIIVDDMEESVNFYTDVLGFEVHSRHDIPTGATITLMKGEGDAMVELIENTDCVNGLYSIGMDVRDVHATVKELKSKGTKVILGPTPITVGTLAFIGDPNGVRIALIEHH